MFFGFFRFHESSPNCMQSDTTAFSAWRSGFCYNDRASSAGGVPITSSLQTSTSHTIDPHQVLHYVGAGCNKSKLQNASLPLTSACSAHTEDVERDAFSDFYTGGTFSYQWYSSSCAVRTLKRSSHSLLKKICFSPN